MDSLVLIIFGITSNLAQIKLIPALYDMAEKGLLPENLSIIGTARGEKTRQEIQDYFHQVLQMENRHHQHEIKSEVADALISKVHFINGHLDDPKFYQKLNTTIEELEASGHRCDNKIFYLATYPELYHEVFENLKSSGLSSQDKGYVRVMIEKPIGNDLESAKKLNQTLLEYFSEDQIYRLDHYLGKETLQNILTFRFANTVFEHLMNKDYIDHIQITASEEYGIGLRGGYYDTVGALKDVGQNHQLQMIAFATMDAPSEFSNEAVTKERLKILQSLKANPSDVVFGQYEGYQQESNVDPSTQTDTFYAFKTQIDNDRFRDVPIYVRAGKKLTQTATEISIVFKKESNPLFGHLDNSDQPPVLIYRVQPNEGIVLKILTKKPGHTLELEPTFMQFCYKTLSNDLPDPYERLISDAIRGDQTFFNDAAEVEAQWAFIDPLFEAKKELHSYQPGTWGPAAADELIEKDGRKWLEPSMDFCLI
jgi:glucose-6-phosphate 1-dehydrogenase